MAMKKITVTQDAFGVVQIVSENLDSAQTAILMLATAIHAVHEQHDKHLRAGVAGEELQERALSLKQAN